MKYTFLIVLIVFTRVLAAQTPATDTPVAPKPPAVKHATPPVIKKAAFVAGPLTDSVRPAPDTVVLNLPFKAAKNQLGYGGVLKLNPYFQVINHGISFLDEIRDVTKQFFELPMEEKRKYSREADGMEGYGSDMIIYEQQILDWTDRLYLTINPEDRRRLKFWPENPKAFR